MSKRRDQILQALARMLATRPGSRITTAALAAEVGVSEAALYRHFPSKAKIIEDARTEVDKLQLLISELQRMQFGRRSEQRDPDQMQLGLEDQEQAEGEDEAAEDAGSSDADRQGKQRAKPKSFGASVKSELRESVSTEVLEALDAFRGRELGVREAF